MTKRLKVLVACEFSGIVRDAFNALGHRAMSCDVLPTEVHGSHYEGDVFDILEEGWDLMIAHPPCTAVCVSGNAHYANTEARSDGCDFIWDLWLAPIDKICIENPVGVMNSYYPDMPKPQYIQPYQFGHDASKKTGLWLKSLPNLRHKGYVHPNHIGRWSNQTPSGQNRLGPSEDRWKLRSTTYKGIAEAMALQWGGVVR